MSAPADGIERADDRTRTIRDIITVDEAVKTLVIAYRVHAPAEAHRRAMRSAERGDADAQAFWLEVTTHVKRESGPIPPPAGGPPGPVRRLR